MSFPDGGWNFDGDVTKPRSLSILYGKDGKTVQTIVVGAPKPKSSIGGTLYTDNEASGVYDPINDAPLVGATIQLWTADTVGAPLALQQTTTSDATGIYGFDISTSGQYLIKVVPTAPFLLDAFGSPDSNVDPTTGFSAVIGFTPGDTDEVDAGMYQYATVNGTVWGDADGDGTLDNGESGISGVAVALYSTTSGQVGPSVVTDDSGNYTFNDLIPGQYYVQVAVPSGDSLTTENASGDTTVDSAFDPTTSQTDTLQLLSGATTVANAGLVGNSTVSGMVWSAPVPESALVGGESPLAGATVTLYDFSNNIIGSPVTTSSDGTYSFSVTPNEIYTVEIVSPSGYTPADSIGVDPAAGQTVNSDTIVAQIATISGQAWLDTLGTGVYASGAGGVAGATVIISDSSGVLDWTTTDSVGNYSFSEAPGQTYTVAFFAPIGYSFTTDSTFYATAIAGQTNTVNAGLILDAVITGSVYGDGGAPLAGLTVSLNDLYLNPAGDSTTTDALGNYTLYAPPAKDASGNDTSYVPNANWYRVHISPPPGDSQTTSDDLLTVLYAASGTTYTLPPAGMGRSTDYMSPSNGTYSPAVTAGELLEFRAIGFGTNYPAVYTVSGAPSGLSIDSSSGVVTWTPTSAQTGTSSFTITGTLGATTVSQTVNVAVRDFANPLPGGPATIDAGNTFNFTVTGHDPSSAVSYSLDAGAPYGATIDSSTGVFSWTPADWQTGTSVFNVIVDWNDGTSDVQTVTVNVRDFEAPFANPVTVSSGTPVVLQAQGYDPTGGAISYSLGADAPSGASIDSDGNFTWTPTSAQEGVDTFTVYANWSDSTSHAQSVTINVRDFPNPLPSGTTVAAGSPVLFQAQATDPTGGAFTFSLDGDAPAGASIDPTTGNFSWTPDETQEGSSTFTVRTTWADGTSDIQQVAVDVTPAATTADLVDNGPNPSTTTQAISLTATITGLTTTPTGTVTLEDASNGNAIIDTGTLVGGAYTFTEVAGTLAAGTHNLFVVYGGDSLYQGSQSATVGQVVVPPIAITSVVVNGDYIGINGASESVNTVTLTTDGSSGFSSGNQIVVAGFSGANIGYNGTWTVTSVSGNQVQYTDTNTGLGTLTNQTAPYAISTNTTSDLLPGLGVGKQRSMVDSIVYAFNAPVNLVTGAITLGLGTATTVGPAALSSAVPNTVLTSLNGGTIWVVTFSSATGNSVVGHSIADGVYTIALNSADVTAVSDGSTMTTTRPTDTFYRMYGDENADKKVNSTDNNKFNGTLNINDGQLGYLAYFDYNGDGKVNGTESTQFAPRLNSTWSSFAPTI